MRVIGVNEFGGPDVLQIVEKPEPHAGPGEVRIAVTAVAVSPTDTMSRAGQGAPMAGPPYVVGMDAAGVVDEVGEGSPFAVGDEVMAITIPAGEHGGAYASFVVGPWQSMSRIPTGSSLEEASTLPMNGLTAVQALEKLALPAGATIAVTGAAGALGGYVVQLAKAAGLTVIADSSPSDEALVAGFGADVVVGRGDDVATRILQAAPEGVDAVVDTALQMSQVTSAVKPGGAFVSFRGWEGDGTPGVRFLTVRVAEEYRSHEKLDALRQAASDGVVTLRVAGVLPAAEAAEAHRRLEAGGSRGRFVLTF
ncbi:NADP-dependent oxidoreductase [Frondihabitans australicus]|uniref:NADPH:quinone reductase-like Zn-dependent oxidoreductase n=1 Tax=Frondihabitans australicus TaxID=386892 RepID=A0A495IIK2_9MICO|nr:NADP-dependent oxidoreductase [Frondihabitans australicus]RKR75599.1 NADPH:quinone reductase-like Zn-dependent oxidoreductase [Frondihabitans australicus]